MGSSRPEYFGTYSDAQQYLARELGGSPEDYPRDAMETMRAAERLGVLSAVEHAIAISRATDADVAASAAVASTKASTSHRQGVSPPPITAVDFSELMAMEVPPRHPLLAPWLLSQSLCMVHGWRGLGKTHFGVGVAHAVATGGAFLSWKAPEPRPVLYIDGELPLRVMQDRLRDAQSRSGVAPETGFLKIVTPDLLSRASPDLGNYADQVELDAIAADVELVICDNLSALLRTGGAENDAESWVTVSDWGLRHRAAGRSVLFVHHSGKNGAQRGTSRREDLLDVVIGLRRPQEYDPGQGARFEVHFEKARHLYGEEIEPFEARLDQEADGGWVFESVEANIDEQIRERLSLGLRPADIAHELGMNKSNVSRRMARMRELGILPAEGGVVRNNQRNPRQKPLKM